MLKKNVDNVLVDLPPRRISRKTARCKLAQMVHLVYKWMNLEQKEIITSRNRLLALSDQTMSSEMTTVQISTKRYY